MPPTAPRDPPAAGTAASSGKSRRQSPATPPGAAAAILVVGSARWGGVALSVSVVYLFVLFIYLFIFSPHSGLLKWEVLKPSGRAGHPAAPGGGQQDGAAVHSPIGTDPEAALPMQDTFPQNCLRNKAGQKQVSRRPGRKKIPPDGF